VSQERHQELVLPPRQNLWLKGIESSALIFVTPMCAAIFQSPQIDNGLSMKSTRCAGES
jgi:hypothetical protein